MKNAKPIAIHLDRLASALSAQGIELQRHQLLEIAAAAFGHRTSNETSRLAEAGDLTPPSAQPIGRIDLGTDSVVLVRDAGTDLPYAIATSFLDDLGDDRTRHFAATPYGGLADLRRVAVSEIPLLTLPSLGARHGEWLAVVQTGDGFHGHVFFNEHTAADLATEISAWCVEHWEDAQTYGREVPSASQRKRMSDLEVIKIYFEAMAGREWLLMDGQESLTDIIQAVRKGIQEASTAPGRPTSALIRDGRFRAYPRTTTTSGMPEEDDHHSSYDTLEEAIATCEKNRVEYHDAAVADHVGRKYWRASWSWKPQDMPALAISGDSDITTFHLDAKDLLEDELADELDRISSMIRNNGYREGETMNRGWWWRILSDKAVRDSEAGGSHGECRRCGCPLDVDGFCKDETCPFSDCSQDDPQGWNGHPQMDDGYDVLWEPPVDMTPLRAARIQHAVLLAHENGIIDAEDAALRLHRRLGFTMPSARLIVEGSHKGANRSDD